MNPKSDKMDNGHSSKANMFDWASSTPMIVDYISACEASPSMNVDEVARETSALSLNDKSPMESDPILTHYIQIHGLLTLKYPHSAAAAMKTVIDIAQADNIRGEKKIEFQTKIIQEFVFNKIDALIRKKIPRCHLEFQLMNIIVEYICNPKQSQAIRNIIITSLFPFENPKIDYFGNVICFAITFSHIEILEAVSTWIQQAGPLTDLCQKLATHILDYFYKHCPDMLPKLIDVATTAPWFTSNLLTATVENFKSKDPSNELLGVVVSWLKKNSKVLVESLNHQFEFLPGAIVMAPITPIAGLFRWCILNPTQEDACDYDKSNAELCSRFMSITTIHYLLLDTILSLQKVRGNKNAVSAQDLEEIAVTLLNIYKSKSQQGLITSDNLALTRLSEALQTTSATNCVFGNKQKLRGILNQIEKLCFTKTARTSRPKRKKNRKKTTKPKST